MSVLERPVPSSVIPLPATTRLGGDLIHRYQIVSQPTNNEYRQVYIVADITDSAVVLNDVGFDGIPFEVDEETWIEAEYRPEYAVSEDGGRVPLWGY